MMNYNFLFDDTSWHKFLLALKKHPVLPKSNKSSSLPFIDSDDYDIFSRCNAIAFKLAFSVLPLSKFTALGILKQKFYGYTPLLIPPLPFSWINLFRTEVSEIPSSWFLSPVLFRLLILLYHLRKSQLLSFFTINIFLRNSHRPLASSPIFLDFPRESQYCSSETDKFKPHTLINTLFDNNIIAKDSKIFSRFNTNFQFKYTFPFHPIPFYRFLLFLYKAIYYELCFIVALLRPQETKVLYLIDDILEYLYLKEDPRAPYKFLFKTVSSQHNSNSLSQLPSSTRNGPLAYTNLIFYSQNDRPLAESDGDGIGFYYEPFPYYSVITWTKEHANYLKSISSYKSYFKSKYLGQIDFIDNFSPIPSFSHFPRRILVFPVDYPPNIISLFDQRGWPRHSIYSKEHYFRFFNDLSLLSLEFDLKVLIKNKRRSINFPSYIDESNFIYLDTGISPRRLIESINPFLVICMPQTSPALYAKSKSIYYYPKTQIALRRPYDDSIPFFYDYKSFRDYLKTKTDNFNSI